MNTTHQLDPVLKAIGFNHLESTLLSSHWFQVDSTCGPLHVGLDDKAPPVELDPALYGFTEADLDREFFLGTWKMKVENFENWRIMPPLSY